MKKKYTKNHGMRKNNDKIKRCTQKKRKTSGITQKRTQDAELPRSLTGTWPINQ